MRGGANRLYPRGRHGGGPWGALRRRESVSDPRRGHEKSGLDRHGRMRSVRAHSPRGGRSMAKIPQSLFSWQDVESLGDLKRLVLVLEAIPDEPLMAGSGSRTGQRARRLSRPGDLELAARGRRLRARLRRVVAARVAAQRATAPRLRVRPGAGRGGRSDLERVHALPEGIAGGAGGTRADDVRRSGLRAPRGAAGLRGDAGRGRQGGPDARPSPGRGPARAGGRRPPRLGRGPRNEALRRGHAVRAGEALVRVQAARARGWSVARCGAPCASR